MAWAGKFLFHYYYYYYYYYYYRYCCHLGLVLIVSKTTNVSLTEWSSVDSVNNGSPNGLLFSTVCLTTHGRLMPRSRMRGALYSSHSYDFVASYLALEEMFICRSLNSTQWQNIRFEWLTPVFPILFLRLSTRIYCYCILLLTEDDVERSGGRQEIGRGFLLKTWSKETTRKALVCSGKTVLRLSLKK